MILNNWNEIFGVVRDGVIDCSLDGENELGPQEYSLVRTLQFSTVAETGKACAEAKLGAHFPINSLMPPLPPGSAYIKGEYS